MSRFSQDDFIVQMKIPQATFLSDALQKILRLMHHPENDLK